MKAAEVLRRYAAGERNFQRENLRGQSFKGADLSGADFSEADIRGTNFKYANLRGVNFTGAKAGLQRLRALLLVIFCWLIAGISGLGSFLAGSFVSLIFEAYTLDNTDNLNIGWITLDNKTTGWISLIVLVTFLIFIIRQGIREGAIVIALLVTIVGLILAFAGTEEIAGSVVFAGIAIVAGLLLCIGAVLCSLQIAENFIGVFTGAVGVAFAVIGTKIETPIFSVPGIAAKIVLLAVAFSILATGVYITLLVLRGYKRDAWVHSFAIAFTANGGTTFQAANLTDAIFTRATLKNTDFRNSILTRTSFRNAKKLDLARPGTTYLNNLKLQKWLTGIGKDNNFDRQILRGVNLQGKILTDASFIGADLSEANLQDADLSRAKLVQAQLDGTDFTGATLTGAFIEDWNITVNTKLHGLRCDYIYLRLPTQEDPDPHRKPDNRNEIFADGDFENFIKPIFDTLDLYHNQNVDPRAIALSWKKLAENNPDAEIRFAAMEVKGEDSLLLRFKTALDADKSQLNAEYFEIYIQLQALNEANKKLLVEKDDRIKELEKMVHSAINAPKYYTDQSRKIEIQDSTIKSSGTGTLGLGDNKGTTANDINQPPSSPDDKNTP
ncbi:MAG: pentapeptide repeat-containing protein [Cyanobacteria bacterium P01_F01_bin.143]